MQTTTAIHVPLLRSISRRQQIAAGCSYREVPTSSVYRHLQREVTGPAVNFAELLIGAQIPCIFQIYFAEKYTKEMNI